MCLLPLRPLLVLHSKLLVEIRDVRCQGCLLTDPYTSCLGVMLKIMKPAKNIRDIYSTLVCCRVIKVGVHSSWQEMRAVRRAVILFTDCDLSQVYLTAPGLHFGFIIFSMTPRVCNNGHDIDRTYVEIAAESLGSRKGQILYSAVNISQ